MLSEASLTMSNEFILPLRVYYEDTDAGGVVYYANYLKFFERARSEWLNHLGIDQAQMLAADIAFAVRRAEVDYKLPARLNDELLVISHISKLSGAGLRFEQRLCKKNSTETTLCEAMIDVVCLQLSDFKPCRIPAAVREEIQRVC